RIAAMKGFLVWASESDDLGWRLPTGFQRVFRLRRSQLATHAENAAASTRLVSKEVATIAVEQLTRLFRFGGSRDRLFMLLGLNCGFSSGEIASLRSFEVFLDGPKPYIHRCRPKTGVEARWVLWPETAALLRANRARVNPRSLWLLTPRGSPLVEV